MIHEFDYSKLVKEPKPEGIIAKVIELSKSDIFYDESFGDQGTIKALDEFRAALGELAKVKLPAGAKPKPIKVRVEIRGGCLESAWVADEHANDVVIERWDWDNILAAMNEDAAEEQWKNFKDSEIDIDPVGFESEGYVWGAWPEAAKVYYCNAPWPFTIINGTKIGAEEMKQQMFPDGENPLGPQAEALDEEFGYYVPFEVMMKGDQAVYDHIKTEIDDQFPGERP
jgi:hypothetical protein